MQQNYTQSHSRKIKPNLSSPFNSDLHIYNFRTLLLEFLTFRTPAQMKHKSCLLGSKGCSSLITVGALLPTALSTTSSGFCSALHGERDGDCICKYDISFRTWNLQIDTRRFSFCPVIFSCTRKHVHIHESILTKRTYSITQNNKSASHNAELHFPDMPGNGEWK